MPRILFRDVKVFDETGSGPFMSRRFIPILLATVLSAAKAATLGPEVTPFVVVSAPMVALRHVNVIDARAGRYPLTAFELSRR
jgi:hypothetical protein